MQIMKNRRLFLILLFSFSLNFIFAISEFSSYDQLISSFPQFLKNNFFEDKDSYYYLTNKDISNKVNSRRWRKNKKESLNNEYDKLRLNTLSNLNESICCGFDVKKRMTNFRENIKDVASSLHLENWSSSFHSVKSTMKISNVKTLFKKQYNNVIVYAIKIDKKDIENINTKCECTFSINTN